MDSFFFYKKHASVSQGRVYSSCESVQTVSRPVAHSDGRQNNQRLNINQPLRFIWKIKKFTFFLWIPFRKRIHAVRSNCLSKWGVLIDFIKSKIGWPSKFFLYREEIRKTNLCYRSMEQSSPSYRLSLFLLLCLTNLRSKKWTSNYKQM